MSTSDVSVILDGAILAAVGAVITWLVARITKARQADTAAAINKAIDVSRGITHEHIDEQVNALGVRIDHLARSVDRIDGREMQTRTDLAELRGRMDAIQEMQRGLITPGDANKRPPL